MSLLRKTEDGASFWCPGCETSHPVNDTTWQIDFETNTLTPSVLVRYRFPKGKVCHSYVRNGQIEYLDDCFHELAGKTVALEEGKS